MKKEILALAVILVGTSVNADVYTEKGVKWNKQRNEVVEYETSRKVMFFLLEKDAQEYAKRHGLTDNILKNYDSNGKPCGFYVFEQKPGFFIATNLSN